MSDQQAPEQAVPEDEMSVADSIGEPVEVGHGGMPLFLAVCIGLILLWAMVAWKPWKGY